jgi:flagellar hook-basal body complex protein FliE
MTGIPTNQALQAYAQAAQALQGRGGAAGAPAVSDEAASGFSDLVQGQLNQVVEQGQTFEARGMDMVQGRTDVVDVVTAVAETEVLLETVVTVRDRVIQAYQEILRMPI